MKVLIRMHLEFLCNDKTRIKRRQSCMGKVDSTTLLALSVKIPDDLSEVRRARCLAEILNLEDGNKKFTLVSYADNPDRGKVMQLMRYNADKVNEQCSKLSTGDVHKIETGIHLK